MSHVSIRVTIDLMVCDGHALCETVAPQVFELGDDERAQVLDVEITDELLPSVEDAVRRCPCQAISLHLEEEGCSGQHTDEGEPLP